MLAVASVIAGGLIFVGGMASYPADGFIRMSELPSSREGFRDYVMMLLAQPEFAGPAFSRQILGDARLELYETSDRMGYFSLPAQASGRSGLDSVLRLIVQDPKGVELAPERAGRLRLETYSLVKSPERSYFFRTSVDNLKIDPELELRFPFRRGEYTLKLPEMVEYMTNRNLYGGNLQMYSGEQRRGRKVVFANHGAMVAKPGEPSLGRFVKNLTDDLPADDPDYREKRIQRLMDVVTREIAYDYEEATSGRETLKRADEVLMTREADCSNKVILFASLLEQIGENYLLIYTPDHIAVAVEEGGFQRRNDHWFEWEGRNWQIAETTAKGFRIGRDHLTKSLGIEDIQFVQRPSEPNRIVALADGEQLRIR